MTYAVEESGRHIGTPTTIYWSYGVRTIFIILTLYTFFITAWVGDDAQITFRQIWNLLNGAGITFNFEERVQSFTHPLWFMVLSVFAYFTRELFLTSILLNTVFAMIAVLVLFKIELNTFKDKLPLLSPIYALIFSWALCDYATSGLENALSYFLVSLLILLFSLQNWKSHLPLMYSILALLVLNRFDYAILFLPVSLMLIPYAIKNGGLFRAVWPGTLILASWIVFATIYFGSPLPNTFFAKLNAGYPSMEVLSRGLEYYSSLRADLVSVVIIAVAIVVSIASFNNILLSLVAGQLAYLLYILLIGGDFMQGRFFAIIVFLSMGQIMFALTLTKSFLKLYNVNLSYGLAIIAIIGLFTDYPFRSGSNYTARASVGDIIDERGAFYIYYGLFSKKRSTWPTISMPLESKPTSYRFTCGFVGGFSLMETDFLTIDNCALADPFLARIPAVQSGKWRIGHHLRKVPTEYGEYKIGNISRLPDNSLKDLLLDVYLVVKGDIFSLERFKAIYRLNSNYYSYIDFDDYRFPAPYIPSTDKMETFVLENWDQEIQAETVPSIIFSNFKRFNSKLRIHSKTPRYANKLELTVDSKYSYDVYVNDNLVGTIDYDDTTLYKFHQIAAFELGEPMLVESITLLSNDVTYLNHPEYNFIVSVHLDGG